jgi:hypothetical protein
MKTIVLNSTNLVGSDNNKFVYKFPNSINMKNNSIAISSISQYFSVFNITSTYNNNSFSYVWFDGETYSVDIPNGYYSLSDINEYLEYTMILNSHYMLDSSGDAVYFLSMEINQTYYGVQLYSYQLDTTIQSANSYTLPSTATWTVPTVATNPQFYFPSNNFYEIVGFSQDYYFPTNSTGYTQTETIVSPNSPQITPYSSFLISCSMVNNEAVIPNNIIFSYTFGDTVFGSLYFNPVPYPAFNDIQDGNYTQFIVNILDQNYNNVVFQDSNTVILLLIKGPKD